MSTSTPTIGDPLPDPGSVFCEEGQENCKSLFKVYIIPAERIVLKNLATSRTEADIKDRRLDVVAVRLVGHLLLQYDLFSPEARDVMERAIASCNKDTDGIVNYVQLCELGRFYLNHLIRPMKSAPGHTPAPSNYCPSRRSFDAMIGRIRQDAQPALTREDTKSYALVRDGYSCMVTSCPDDRFYELYRNALRNRSNQPVADTQCCHIIPFSINNIKEDDDIETFGLKLEGTTIFWSILKMFGYDIQPDLKDEKINRLENVMTLSSTIHIRFDDLNFWLEEVEGKENTYRTCLPRRSDDADMRERLMIPPEVHFKVHDVDLVHRDTQDLAPLRCQPRHLALPNPRYLRLRAACCRVAHLSGAVEYLEEIHRDTEMLAVLTNDGSSADVLDAALWNIRELVPPV